jgi:DNA ligase-1
MFEKYDGMRGFWHPHRKAFFSRGGNKLIVPSTITSAMPDIMLDGELWYLILSKRRFNCIHITFTRFGRENFQEAMKLANRLDPTLIDWKRFRFEVFDVPTHPGTFQQRYTFLGTVFFFMYYT